MNLLHPFRGFQIRQLRQLFRVVFSSIIGPEGSIKEELFLLDPFTDLLFGMFCIAHYCFLCPVDFVHIPLFSGKTVANLMITLTCGTMRSDPLHLHPWDYRVRRHLHVRTLPGKEDLLPSVLPAWKEYQHPQTAYGQHLQQPYGR